LVKTDTTELAPFYLFEKFHHTSPYLAVLGAQVDHNLACDSIPEYIPVEPLKLNKGKEQWTLKRLPIGRFELVPLCFTKDLIYLLVGFSSLYI
jgi:hypothetical protein